MEEQKIVLTPEQEKLVLDTFNGRTDKNMPSITELVQLAFPTVSDADGRSIQGRCIKILLAQKGLKAKTTNIYIPKDKKNLSETDKEFIKNNRSQMVPVEMARTLFANPNISNLHMETRTIAAFLKETFPEEQDQEVLEVPEDEYRPPKTSEGVLRKIEKYVLHHGIDKVNVTAQQKAGLEALLSYMSTYRFCHQINLYENQTHRNLFESSFVRYTYNKPDLTEEECDQYITLAHESVENSSIQRRKEKLNRIMEEVSGEERARISVGLVDALNTLQTELHQSLGRSQKLLNDLKEKRSDRMAELKSANASILNLVQIWKEEASRKKLIHLAEARKKLVSKAANELAGLSEIKSRIMGVDMQEILDS